MCFRNKNSLSLLFYTDTELHVLYCECLCVTYKNYLLKKERLKESIYQPRGPDIALHKWIKPSFKKHEITQCKENKLYNNENARKPNNKTMQWKKKKKTD